MATYAIGDIQGCYDPLRRLLEQIAFDSSKDQLWLCGDLINRGPDSLKTLRFLYGLRNNITCVLGNHDLHFLAVLNNQRHISKHDTLQELMGAPDCDELAKWLRHFPLLHHSAALGYTMVHAGIPPQWDLNTALAHAAEVEKVLRSKDHNKRHLFFNTMYGNEPAVWRDDLSQQQRWRIITNYFTRMRFCTAEGELELTLKENAEQAPVGYAPWFAHPQRKTAHDKIIFGHWAALEGKTNTANIYALDTGCVWGGALTAMRLEDGKLYCCPCEGN